MKSLSRFLILVLVSCSAAAQSELLFSNAWIQDGPPMMPMRAAYMTIENRSNHAIQVDSVSSPVFAQIEMHQTRIENGVATMHELQQIELPAATRLEFKPGSNHLMLMQPQKLPKVGDLVPFTLHTSSGDFSIEMPVKKP